MHGDELSFQNGMNLKKGATGLEYEGTFWWITGTVWKVRDGFHKFSVDSIKTERVTEIGGQSVDSSVLVRTARARAEPPSTQI